MTLSSKARRGFPSMMIMAVAVVLNGLGLAAGLEHEGERPESIALTVQAARVSMPTPTTDESAGERAIEIGVALQNQKLEEIQRQLWFIASGSIAAGSAGVWYRSRNAKETSNGK